MFRFGQAHVVDEHGRSFGGRSRDPALLALGIGPSGWASNPAPSTPGCKAPLTPFTALQQSSRMTFLILSHAYEGKRARKSKRRRMVSTRSRVSSESKKILAKWLRRHNSDKRDGRDVAAANRTYKELVDCGVVDGLLVDCRAFELLDHE